MFKIESPDRKIDDNNEAGNISKLITQNNTKTQSGQDYHFHTFQPKATQ